LIENSGDLVGLQRQTIRVLQSGVVPAGLAMTAGFSACALLGLEITGSETKGALAAVCLSTGGSLAGLPLGLVMARRGRRVGLSSAYAIGSMGAVLGLTAALFSSYPLLILGMLLIGCGQAGNLAARYAGADLATDANRARSISLVMWATTVGSVLGPTLGLGLSSIIGSDDGAARFAPPYVLAAVLFLIASASIHLRLRPDPLQVAVGNEQGQVQAPSFAAFKGVIFDPMARLAVIGMMLSQGVMVGTMTVTPLHMRDGGQATTVIGLMISVHIVGMYALSPLIGRITDRIGGPLVVGAGAIISAVGAEIASHTDAAHATGHIVGLLLVGVGWCCAVVAGAALLTSAFSPEVRVASQATADVMMTAMGAVAGISSGLAVEQRSYHDLAHWATLVSIFLAVIVVVAVVQASRVRETGITTG
jgi:MFS family permease